MVQPISGSITYTFTMTLASIVGAQMLMNIRLEGERSSIESTSSSRLEDWRMVVLVSESRVVSG